MAALSQVLVLAITVAVKALIAIQANLSRILFKRCYTSSLTWFGLTV